MIHTCIALIAVLASILPVQYGNPYTLTEPGRLKIYWADPQEAYPWFYVGEMRLQNLFTGEEFDVTLAEYEIIQRDDGKFDVLYYSERFCRPGMYRITSAALTFTKKIDVYLLGVFYLPLCHKIQLPMISN